MLRIAVAIATAGRKAVLSDTIRFLGNQARPADEVLICPAKSDDVDLSVLAENPNHCRIISSKPGLPAQRNAIMDACDADIILFFDDDFLPAPDYLAEVEHLFLSDPFVLVATGKVLADGILGPGIEFQQAIVIIEAAGDNGPQEVTTVYNGYGCNMAIRRDKIAQAGLRFDENLPSYAWLEDVDFCRQAAQFGRIVQSSRLRGVHLGTKSSGRSPGRRLGYSQIANPVYLARKGTMSWRKSFKHMLSNFIANLVKSPMPEPWVDRKGRLKGNLRALADLVRGKMRPDKILDL